MVAIQRKLAAIFAADVHEFSRLMGEDEAGTLRDLRACRGIIDGLIAAHHGRIFGSAGDSVLAEFASAVSAIECAVACQTALAARNVGAAPQARPMNFRIGINIGDVIVEGDNLYGDGVNVAARLEALARPGAICVSAKVHDEVRRKLADLRFVDGGAQKLKNIADPVRVHHLAPAGEIAIPARPGAGAVARKPLVAVQKLRVIAGGEEVQALADGLSEAVRGAVARSSALAVTAGDATDADFVLKGSVQGAGKRVRLSYALEDSSAQQIWTERYDRELADVFDLEDEIVLRVTAAIRFSVKTRLFEQLRDSDDATLAVPQLLDKGAGLFSRSRDRDGAAVATLRLAVERAPQNAMARAMLAFALFRMTDYAATTATAAQRAEIEKAIDRAIALDPRNYFIRTVKAITLYELAGDIAAAREQAQEALKGNANFVPAKALVAIADIQSGDVEDGVRRLQEAITASPEDASDLRHRRELALGHWLAGRTDEALRIAGKLWREHSYMKRNALVLAALLAASGDLDTARREIEEARRQTPGLTLDTARLPRIADAATLDKFKTLLRDAGL